jgi:hypothetical protein
MQHRYWSPCWKDGQCLYRAIGLDAVLGKCRGTPREPGVDLALLSAKHVRRLHECICGRIRRSDERDQLWRMRQSKRSRHQAASNDSHRSPGCDRAQDLWAAKQSMDPRSQIAPALPGPKRKRFAQPQSLAVLKSALGKSGEASGVCSRGFRPADYAVVTRYLALGAEAALEPPERWIEREGGQAELLQQVCPVVPATKMLRLVQHNLLKLSRGEPAQQPGGNQDARAEEADDAGAVEIAGHADLYRGGPAGGNTLPQNTAVRSIHWTGRVP